MLYWQWWLVRIISLLLLLGCRGAGAPLPVSIVTPMEVTYTNKVTTYCPLVGEFPTPPEPIALNFDDDDIIRRTTVNIRQYNTMVTYAHDMQIWAQLTARCIQELTSNR